MTKATVKWFNPKKGFGFVSPEDGSPDAFLHISVVERAGYAVLPDGTEIDCLLGLGQKGSQVEEINSVEMAAAAAGGGDDAIDGTVKWFNPTKGFGFVQLDDGGKDVFIHVSVLQRAGVMELLEGQRVRVTTSQGQKGPQAETLEFLS